MSNDKLSVYPFSVKKTLVLYTICFVVIIELRHEKTSLQGFRPGPTRTGLYTEDG